MLIDSGRQNHNGIYSMIRYEKHKLESENSTHMYWFSGGCSSIPSSLRKGINDKIVRYSSRCDFSPDKSFTLWHGSK